MKKLCLLLVAVMLSSFLNVYADAPVKFEGKDTLNVVYFGGSITYGSGAAAGKSWRDLVGQWFVREYPGTVVNNYNAGIGGTGSELGYYRAHRDVLAKNADIVFMEFAVNDLYKTEQETQYLMESIVRGILKEAPDTYIIFVYTSEIKDGEYTDASVYQEKIAEYYEIPDIDLQPVIEEYLAEDGNVAQGGFFCSSDTVHPSDVGYALYAEEIIECLETGDYFKAPVPLDVNTTSYVEGNYEMEILDCALPKYDAAYNNSEVVTLTGNWTKKTHYQHGDYMFTSTPGATLEYKFSGPVLGMLALVSDGGGQLKVELDGVNIGILDRYYKLAGDNPVTATESTSLGFDRKDLSDSEHILKLTVLDTINANNKLGTHDVGIYGFFSSAIVRGLDVTVNNDARTVRVTNKTNVIDGEPFSIGVWPGNSADAVDFDNDADGRVGESAVCIDQGIINDEKIDYTFTMLSDAVSGEYYVQVRNLNDDEILWTTFLFQNIGRRDETIELIDAHNFEEYGNSLANFLEARLKDVDVEKGVQYEGLSSERQAYVLAELDGYSVYNDGTDEDFESKLNDAFYKMDLLSKLKDESKFEAAQSEMLANDEKFGIDEYMDRFNALTQGSKDYAMLYFREHVNEIVTPAGIPSKFDAAITAAVNRAGSDDPYSPGPSNPGPYNPGPSNPGPSGVGNVTGGMTSVDTPLDPTADSGEVFTDLGSVEWARTAITTLAKKGVINGKGNQKFAPLDNVTREEYVKMIMVAFDIETEPANLKFEDVDENAWYYPYIAQAVSYGIINGISDTEFGTGKNITRQDAAVILSRAVEKDKYVELYTVDANFKFNDIDKVSDYAAAAVEALGKAKIFSGKENDMFDPFGQATRAEAAMILYNLLYK